MCKTCEIERARLIGWELEDYQAVFCLDAKLKVNPLLAPQIIQTPKERFDCQQFGILLCQLRESRNLTQADAAQRVGVSRRTWNAIEAGRRLPRIDTVAAIAEAFDKSIEDLFRVP